METLQSLLINKLCAQLQDAHCPLGSYTVNREDLQELVSIALVFCLLAIPIGILGWQSYQFLQTGSWQPFSCLDVLEVVGIFEDLTNAPKDWLGVHKILNWLHGSILVLGVFLVPLFFIMGLLDDGT